MNTPYPPTFPASYPYWEGHRNNHFVTIRRTTTRGTTTFIFTVENKHKQTYTEAKSKYGLVIERVEAITTNWGNVANKITWKDA